MRHLLSAALGATLLVSTAVPALAHPTIELAPTLPTDLTHHRTDNIDYLGRFPEHFGTAGGRLVGDRFYLTDPRGVYVYDVSAPADPKLLDALELYQTGTGAALAQEDPDTNGEILIVDGADSPNGGSRLTVVDVSDPEGEGLSVLSTLPVTDHTWTCVSAEVDGERNSCAFVYGRTGHIVDLTDPANPRKLGHTWRAAVGYTAYAHDLTEFAPGLVMSAGADAVLLDTSNPAVPVRLNAIEQAGRWSQFGYHSVEWANGGTDDILIAGTELAPPGPTSLAGSDCESEQSVIETWDASAVAAALEAYRDGDGTLEAVQAAEFERIDAFDAGGRGIFLTGQAPAHVLYCAHWMEPHPDFDGGGLLAVSYYDRGTRFVEVNDGTDDPDQRGTMTEIGWIVPAEGYSGSVQWVGSDDEGDIAYIMDYRRGMEVVRIRPQVDATTVVSTGVDVIAAGATVTPLGATTSSGVPTSSAVAAGLGVALAGVGLTRRRRARAEA